ncbi:MAG TPA: hypothetical protein VIF61_05075, partial [Methylocystis sp.]
IAVTKALIFIVGIPLTTIGLLFFLWDNYRPSTRWEPNSTRNHGILFRPACQAEARARVRGKYAGRLEKPAIARLRGMKIFLSVLSLARVTKAIANICGEQIKRDHLGVD